MDRIQTSASQTRLLPVPHEHPTSLLASSSALLKHPALRPLLLSAGLAAAKVIAARLLGRPKRVLPEPRDTGSGVFGVIVRGALSGVLHTLPVILAQRVARKALHRAPSASAAGLGGLRLAEDASRGEAF